MARVDLLTRENLEVSQLVERIRTAFRLSDTPEPRLWPTEREARGAPSPASAS